MGPRTRSHSLYCSLYCMLSKLLINIFLHFLASPLGQARCHGPRNTNHLWNIYGKSMGIIYGKAWVGQKVATYTIILQFNEGLIKNLNIQKIESFSKEFNLWVKKLIILWRNWSLSKEFYQRIQTFCEEVGHSVQNVVKELII